MSGPKWLPQGLQASYHLFNDLSRAAVTFKWLTNRYLNEITFDDPDIYVRIETNKINTVVSQVLARIQSLKCL